MCVVARFSPSAPSQRKDGDVIEQQQQQEEEEGEEEGAAATTFTLSVLVAQASVSSLVVAKKQNSFALKA